ncbi:MAG: GyrI-like domain-containing protein [Candidatus Hodarchaeales archaeon]|jgi:AraC family transcriptional regulator
MTNKETVAPKRIEITDEEKSLRLVGCIFYGDPFHAVGGWSEKNEIGLTWQRFMDLYEQHKDLIQKHQINQNLMYEIHIEPAEYNKTKRFYVFVGVEVSAFDQMPLGMFAKILPPAKYAIFTFQGKKMFSGGDFIWKKWLPNSDYREIHPFLIQAYDSKRFRGLDSEDSELDYYIPIELKE